MLFSKIKGIFSAVHHFLLRKVVPKVQFVLVNISLFFIYFIAFGLTSLFLRIFSFRTLSRSKKLESYWETPKDRPQSLEAALRQS